MYKRLTVKRTLVMLLLFSFTFCIFQATVPSRVYAEENEEWPSEDENEHSPKEEDGHNSDNLDDSSNKTAPDESEPDITEAEDSNFQDLEQPNVTEEPIPEEPLPEKPAPDPYLTIKIYLSDPNHLQNEQYAYLLFEDRIQSDDGHVAIDLEKYFKGNYIPYQYEIENYGIQPYNTYDAGNIFKDFQITYDTFISVYFIPNTVVSETTLESRHTLLAPNAFDSFTVHDIFENARIISGTGPINGKVTVKITDGVTNEHKFEYTYTIILIEQWSILVANTIHINDIITVTYEQYGYDPHTITVPIHERTVRELILGMITEGDTIMRGTGEPGAALMIEVTISGILQFSNTVTIDANGAWEMIYSYGPLPFGAYVSAILTLPDGYTDLKDAIVLQKSAPPSIIAYNKGDPYLKGEGIYNAQIIVSFPSGQEEASVTISGEWSVAIPENTNGLSSAVQIEAGKGYSDPVSFTVYPPDLSKNEDNNNSGSHYYFYPSTLPLYMQPEYEYISGKLTICGYDEMDELIYMKTTVYETGRVLEVTAPALEGFVLKDDAIKRILIASDKQEIRFSYHSDGFAAEENAPLLEKQDMDQTVHYAYISSKTGGKISPDSYIGTSGLSELLYGDGLAKGYLKAAGFMDVEKINISAFISMAGVSMTRGEFVVLLSNLHGAPEKNTSGFADVQGHWAKGHIAYAESMGWIVGHTDGAFRPDSLITKSEAVAIMNRSLLRYPTYLPDSFNPFSDLDSSHWAYYDILEAAVDHIDLPYF